MHAQREGKEGPRRLGPTPTCEPVRVTRDSDEPGPVARPVRRSDPAQFQCDPAGSVPTTRSSNGQRAVQAPRSSNGQRAVQAPRSRSAGRTRRGTGQARRCAGQPPYGGGLAKRVKKTRSSTATALGRIRLGEQGARRLPRTSRDGRAVARGARGAAPSPEQGSLDIPPPRARGMPARPRSGHGRAAFLGAPTAACR